MHGNKWEIIGDAIGAFCVVASPFVFLFITHGFGF